MQTKAFQSAFWTVMVVQIVLIVIITSQVPMSPMFAPVVSIVVGVVTALGYGQWLERG